MFDIATGEAPIIYAYTAKDAVADGQSVQLDPTLCIEAGFHIPVIMTRAAWNATVRWDRDDGTCDETGRAWDVLAMGRRASKTALANDTRIKFAVLAVPNRTASGRISQAETPRRVILTAMGEGFDRTGTPCIVFALPGED